MTTKAKASPKKAKPKTLSTKSANPRARQIAEDKAWQARQDLRTLQEAKEIQRDRHRITAAEAEALKQIAAINSVVKNK
jgi:hypothetical protein